MSPIACADSPRSRTAYTRKIEITIMLKKFDSATVIAIARQSGCPRR